MTFYIFQIYKWAQYYIYLTYFFFYNYFFNLQIKKPVDSPEKILYDRELKKFHNYEISASNDSCEKNQNIESFYYNKTEYKTVFQDINNQHEVLWKRRILYMTTPYGNIAMYYDPYKLGFSYYADQSHIKYDILNAIAMKYVTIFRCLDFFMDEYVTMFPSPLIKIHCIEDKKEDIKNPNFNAMQAAKKDKSPFAKFKKPNTDVLPPVLKQRVTICVPNNKKDMNRNRFLYLGKMQNMNFIQPIPKMKRMLPVFQSALLDGIEKNASIQSECFSYKDYIKMKQQMNTI